MMVAAALILGAATSAWAQAQDGTDGAKKFSQLDDVLAPPSPERTATGVPGPAYWQQRADYHIKARLDEKKRRLTGSEVITYHNNSPLALPYVWLYLEQNRFRPDSLWYRARPSDGKDRISFTAFRQYIEGARSRGGFHVTAVRDKSGADLPYKIVQTAMRVDLPRPLQPGESLTLAVDWWYNIIDSKAFNARSGYEFFADDGNDIFEIAQWYPRMAAFTDVRGWRNKQFLERGEFTLEFGDFQVELTVPADHIVSATGALQNPQSVLSPAQRARLKAAREAKKPVFVVTPQEALENQKKKTRAEKTWVFAAKNVRDFAFATSRKFIWDAQGYRQPQGGKVVMAMSFYPPEGAVLWRRYATQAIIHTLDVYSRFTFPYPYPLAQAVNGPAGGMEYPMLAFAAQRPQRDATGAVSYSRRDKYQMISVVIHEVGHNYFPMIVNSDERQWSWMDEGLNTFLQHYAEQEWEEDYPSQRADAEVVAAYMTSKNQQPIMTAADSLRNPGASQYMKPAAALTVLREVVLGRDLFDFAFRNYARQWMFKRPMPADFFRAMEDASGVDLDWFWRGWFYTRDHVDIALEAITRLRIDTANPDDEAKWEKRQDRKAPKPLSHRLPAGVKPRVDRQPSLRDFYNKYDKYTVTEKSRRDYRELMKNLEPFERDLLKTRARVYDLHFVNKGGLVMPIVLELTFSGGRTERLVLPAEIWRLNSHEVHKLLVLDKPLVKLVVDPDRATIDSLWRNNSYPRPIEPMRVQLTTTKKGRNLMREIKAENEAVKKAGRP
jgi:hypothetical protein